MKTCLSIILVAAICSFTILHSENSYGDFFLPPGLPNGNGAFPVPPPGKPKNENGLIKRVVPLKPTHTVVGPGVYRNLITVKFSEGSDIRLRGGRLTSLRGADIGALHRVLALHKVSKIGRLFGRPEPDLENERQEGQRKSGEELADLALYHSIEIDETTDPEALIDALNNLAFVEIAYPAPISQPAANGSGSSTTPPAPPPAAQPTDIPPVTPSLVDYQGYLGDPPLGIGAQWAWANKGYSRGQGVTVVDVEGGWNVDHEDLELTAANIVGGTNRTDDPKWHQHGTAVLGVIAGYNNSYGVTGIASEVGKKLVSAFDGAVFNAANAINIAASHSGFGDILLIELQNGGPTCNPAYVPAEHSPAEFDAIKTATANGKIAVEAAGNGGVNLDDATCYGNLFDRSARDSGAILVGAGASPNIYLAPANFSNYGSRVDVQGWGQFVTTTGCSLDFPCYFDGGGDVNQFYTGSFGGTSSASAVVTGASAVIQSHFRNAKGSTLNSNAMRQLLVNTGTPQQQGNHIGPMPNLVNALSQQLPTVDIKANGSDGPIFISGATPVDLVASLDPGGFANAEADWWVAAYVRELGTWYYLDSSGQWTTQAVPIYQGPLFALGPASIYTSLVPSWYTYDVYARVDLNRNGIADTPLYYDVVTVTVSGSGGGGS